MNLLTAHNEWKSRPRDQRFQSVHDLMKAVQERRSRSKDITIDIKSLGVKEVECDNGDTTIAFNDIIAPTEPSHWSFGQLATAIHAPAGYLRSLPTKLAVENINYGIRHRADDEKVKLLSLVDRGGGMNQLGAITTPRYGRIWDADVVFAVQRIVDKTGGRFYNPPAYVKDGKGATEPAGLYASDHDVFMFMIDGGSQLEAGPRAKLNRGFICWNSEVGARTLGIMTFLFNECCGNHIIWGASEVNTFLLRHTSKAPEKLATEAVPHLQNYLEMSAKNDEAVIARAQAMNVVSLLPAAALVSKAEDAHFPKAFISRFSAFSKGEVVEAVEYAKREEGQCVSLWDMVQGFTASARDYSWADTRLDLEQRAGKLLQIAANTLN